MNFSSPNQHCLDRLVKLSEQQSVTAANDIFDDQGFKLWAKGAPVSRDLQVKLVRRKLAKPLECSLSAEHAVTSAEIIDDCLHQVEQQPSLQQIAGARAAQKLLTQAKTLQIPPPLRLLLTTVRQNDANIHVHVLRVLAICAGIAAKLDLPEKDLHTLLMAAILHDLGEIYINPEYFSITRRLTPPEWKHVVSHPRIGQMLIQELTTLPPAIAHCVGQHHERHNGSGYPCQSQRADQYRLAGWIAVADTAAALLSAGDEAACAHTVLALHIVPGEFDRDAAGVLIQALRQGKNQHGMEAGNQCISQAHHMLTKIEQASSALHNAATTSEIPFVRQTCSAAQNKVLNISLALRATGVLEAEMLGESANDPELLAEMELIVREVKWRMSNLARTVYLRSVSQPCHEPLAALNEIVELIES